MRRFVNGEVDILVSTMIVESGLDVPNANTMIVHDAHRFGLAQLYQLRGRVGRSHRRAYCYLIGSRHDRSRAPRSGSRCSSTIPTWGPGYRIALKDMELRGAGNLLGSEQSGHAHAVGFDLYLRWLEETVPALRGREGGESRRRRRTWSSTVRRTFRTPMSRTTRPSWTCTGDWRGRSAPAKLMSCAQELRERFGPLPPEAEHLLDMTRLRVLGARLGLQHVLVRGDEARLTFRQGATPRMAGLTQALDDVQLAADVRRTVPLSLRLVRLGGEATDSFVGPGTPASRRVSPAIFPLML